MGSHQDGCCIRGRITIKEVQALPTTHRSPGEGKGALQAPFLPSEPCAFGTSWNAWPGLRGGAADFPSKPDSFCLNLSRYKWLNPSDQLQILLSSSRSHLSPEFSPSIISDSLGSRDCSASCTNPDALLLGGHPDGDGCSWGILGTPPGSPAPLLPSRGARESKATALSRERCPHSMKSTVSRGREPGEHVPLEPGWDTGPPGQSWDGWPGTWAVHVLQRIPN